MDSEILEALAGFDRLWERVGGAEGPQKACPEETLASFIDAEAAAAELFAALAARRGNPAVRRVLAEMAARDRRHLARLQLEFFLLTGDSRAPRGVEQPETRGLEALRAAYKKKLAAAHGYTEAAEERTELAALYTELAAEETLAATEIRRLIANAMDCSAAGGLQ